MGLVLKIVIIAAAAIGIICLLAPLGKNDKITNKNLNEKAKVSISFTFISLFIMAGIILAVALSFCCCAGGGIVCGAILVVLGGLGFVCSLIALLTYYQGFTILPAQPTIDAWLMGAVVSSLNLALFGVAFIF